MDRFDMFCWVKSVKYEELVSINETTDPLIKKGIQKAREIQLNRFETETILTNAEMRIPEIKKYCHISSNSENVLRELVDSGKLSARGFHRVLKTARTIADLNETENITTKDINEALSYRLRDRQE